MFDNPNQNLKKLQEQLLAAEEPEEDIFAPAREEYQPDDPEEYPGEYPEEYAEDPEEEADARERQRKTRQSFLLALLLLEVALLFGVLAWWLLW